MALLKIRTYPDPVLMKKCEPVSDFGPETQKFIDDMIESMYEFDGVGLAAPQVGVSKQILVATPKAEPGKEIVFVNPEITSAEGRVLDSEGCLSFPGVVAEVYRARKIQIKYQDRMGNSLAAELKDFFARVLQHEADHLAGVVFIDRVDFNQRQRILAGYQRT